MKQQLATVAVFAMGVFLGAGLSFSANIQAEEKVGEKAALPMQELRSFAEIFGRIKENYVDPVDDRELLEYAIRGMLSGLDPHSSYLDADDFKELQEGTSGQFGGLGIEVGMTNGFVRVISPIDDTPAQKAGVKAGDQIIRLDETPVKGMSLEEAVKLMRGKVGSAIILTIVREGENSPLKIKIVRDVIKVASVRGRMLAPGIGYLRISHFQSRTTEDMLKQLGQLKQESAGGLKGLVLDLRNNPGGILSGAVAVSDAFVTEGNIVYTKGRDESSRMDFKAAPDDVLDGAPIVVLVNGGSASASEIVAGALQDHRRAVIMGSQTFGKGSVQTIIPVGETTAVKLTTARYFTPLGRSIQGEGITPDIILSDVKVTAAAPRLVAQIKEADLSRHLDKGVEERGESDSSGASTTKASSEREKKSLVQEDYQLNEALNLLKGLVIFNRRG